MAIMDIGSEVFVPIMIFSIPIVAIVGGITAGIVKIIAHHRMIELAQRERIAAIERGIDPSKLPPLPAAAMDEGGSVYVSHYDYSRRRSQNMMIAGIITLLVGVGVSIFLRQVAGESVWAVGVIPALAGLGLLISAIIVRPHESDRNGGTPPTSR
jgi:hypothetical protein